VASAAIVAALVSSCGSGADSTAAISSPVKPASSGSTVHGKQTQAGHSASPSPTTSPVPHSAVVREQKANAKAQEAAAPKGRAHRSAATEKVTHPGPVSRRGQTVKDRKSAVTRKFDKAVRYSDGVTVAVRKIGHTTSVGEGPGAVPGLPVTTFKIRIHNGSENAIDLNQVVVTATIKNGAEAARPIYFDGVADFFGSVKPNSSKVSTYAFTIPTANLDEVVLTVDFDAKHRPATFSGSVR